MEIRPDGEATTTWFRFICVSLFSRSSSAVAVLVKSAYLLLQNPQIYTRLLAVQFEIFHVFSCVIPVNSTQVTNPPYKLSQSANFLHAAGINCTRWCYKNPNPNNSLFVSMPADSCIHLSTSYPWRSFPLLLLHLLLLLPQHPHSFQVHVLEIYIVNNKVVENADGRVRAHSF